jgi:hypothetical protein
MNGDVEAKQGLYCAAGLLAARWNMEGGRGRCTAMRKAVWTEWMRDSKRKESGKVQGEKFPDIRTNYDYLMPVSEH